MDLSFSTNLLNFSNSLFEEAEEMMTSNESVIIGLCQTIKDLLIRCQSYEDANNSLEMELVRKEKTVSEVTKELTIKNAQLLDSRTQIRVLHKHNKELEGKVEKLVGVIDVLRKATSGEIEFDALNALIDVDTTTFKTRKERDSEPLDENMFDKTGDSCDDFFTVSQNHHRHGVTNRKRSISVSEKCESSQTPEVNQNVTDAKIHVGSLTPVSEIKETPRACAPAYQLPKTKVRRSLSETTIYSCKQNGVLANDDDFGISSICGGSIASLNSNTIENAWVNDIHDIASRSHSFEKYSLAMGYCDCCKAFVIRSKAMHRCRDCRIVCHPECTDRAPKPCIPKGGPYKSVSKTKFNLSDICPHRFPFIPFIVVHCVVVLEKFYLTTEGLYRIPGAESDVTKLYNAFLYNKSLPSFKDVEPETITGCLKKFLNELRAPLIPRSSWKEFVSAVRCRDNNTLAYAIADLPAPNLHTLSYLCLHWLKVAEHCQQNKMPSENIAKILGPTIIGFSKSPGVLTKTQMENETESQYLVMLALLQLPESYWMQFLTRKNIDGKSKTPIGAMNTLKRKQLYQEKMCSGGQSNAVFSPLVVRY
uniref:Rac GTPase-activating protein 1 n=1 Tax=Strongyloides papillosus TaxID=174720 RepID=A0A0N5C7L1_STREA